VAALELPVDVGELPVDACELPVDACDPAVGEVLDFFALDPHAATVRITANIPARRTDLLALLTVANLPGAGSFVIAVRHIE
jgi:hypothetical protein